jgi:hypothetical protein
MKEDSLKVGTWPTPEHPRMIDIPLKYLREFENEARIVIKHPFVIGIPAPLSLIEKMQKNPKVFKELLNDFEIMMVPK